eukprot:CAMPEP_0180704998 /NCGR_PEP_ID=MMETSP1038_2-20121128/7446_1 /TAXON_ID=632150 /ORGANISM="Azadinium spinosum, Strain 3D9" /LENGTH=245 /DNA_ID=CAMNT_0022736851 /DNA_START=115 /DNA_END=850 /DNA_ORIENTATION=+
MLRLLGWASPLQFLISCLARGPRVRHAARTSSTLRSVHAAGVDHIDVSQDYLVQFTDGVIEQRAQMLPIAFEELRAVLLSKRSGIRVELRPTAVRARPDSLLWLLVGSGLSESEMADVVCRCVLVRVVYRPLVYGVDIGAIALAAESVLESWSETKRMRTWSLGVRSVHHPKTTSLDHAGESLAGALRHLTGRVSLTAPDTRLLVLEEFAPAAVLWVGKLAAAAAAQGATCLRGIDANPEVLKGR